VEQEGLPIGDSSSEESPHGASDSGSSSFERLVDPGLAGKGGSRPCEGGGAFYYSFGIRTYQSMKLTTTFSF